MVFATPYVRYADTTPAKVTTGLTGAASALLQVASLFLYFIHRWLFGDTPRQAYKKTYVMPKVRTSIPTMSPPPLILCYSRRTLASSCLVSRWSRPSLWRTASSRQSSTGSPFSRSLFCGWRGSSCLPGSLTSRSIWRPADYT